MSFSTLKSNPAALKIFARILFRSSAYSIAAYFISMILEKILIMAGAAVYGYSTRIDYKEVGVIAEHSTWNQESILIIYLFPSIILAIIFVLLYIFHQKWYAKPSYIMVFTNWLMFFTAYRLVGMIPVHLFCKTGISHAFNWLYLGLTFNITISFIGIILFFIVANQTLKGILFFSGTHNNQIRAIGLPNLVYSSLIVPALLSLIIPLLFYLPGLPKDEIIGLFVIAIVSTYIFSKLLLGRPEFFPKGDYVKEKSHPLRLFSIILILIIIFRIILGIGLYFN